MNITERFWSKVGEPDANGCWPWLGYRAPSGKACRSAAYYRKKAAA